MQLNAELVSRYLHAQRQANAKLAIELNDPVLYAESVWCIRGDQDKPYSMKGFEFLDKIVRSNARIVDVMACSGVGKTEIFLPWTLFRAASGRRMIYAFENDQKTGLIVQERVNPNLDKSPYFKNLCKDTDNVKFKKVGKGFVYFIGFGKESSTTTIHADDAVLDEFDQMEPDKAAAALKRLTSSPDPKVRRLGNPRMEGAGIHQVFCEGDQQLLHVVCEHCSYKAPIEFDSHVDFETFTFRCPSCKKPMDRMACVYKAAVEEAGGWIATNPGAPEGHESYKINSLMSPTCDLENVCKELLSEDREKRRAAWTFNKAEPYKEKGGSLTDSDLWNADGGPTWTKKAPGGALYCDPGGNFDVQIFQPQVFGKPPHCTWYGTVSGFPELRELIEESGVMYGLIDYGPEITSAKDLCMDMAKLGKQFMRVSYKLGDTEGTPAFVFDQNDELLIAAQRTMAADLMVDDIRKGNVKYPSRAVRTATEPWAVHMKKPQRKVEISERGKRRYIWTAIKPDHQFHVSIYAAIGNRIWVAEESRQRKATGSRSF